MTKHTDAFNRQIGRVEGKASSQEVIAFTAGLSSEQTREVMARIKARDGNSFYIGNREIYNYCKEFGIEPERVQTVMDFMQEAKKHYHLLEDNQDLKVDGNECFVMSNDTEKKLLTIMFYHNNEVKEIEY